MTTTSPSWFLQHCFFLNTSLAACFESLSTMLLHLFCLFQTSAINPVLRLKGPNQWSNYERHGRTAQPMLGLIVDKWFKTSKAASLLVCWSSRPNPIGEYARVILTDTLKNNQHHSLQLRRKPACFNWSRSNTNRFCNGASKRSGRVENGKSWWQELVLSLVDQASILQEQDGASAG